MPGSSTAVAACTRLASTQFGVISTDQALEVGLSLAAMQRLVDSGAWDRIRTGVYAIWPPRDPNDRWRQALKAVVLWLGCGAAVSHRAAGALWVLDGAGSRVLEFVTARRTRTSDPDLTIHHYAPLRPDEVRDLHGLPVTAPARTLADLASVLPAKRLELAVESALRRELTTRRELDEWIQRARPPHPGKGVLRSMLRRLSEERTGSVLETLLSQLEREKGLPPAVRQYNILDGLGRFVARTDFAYPQFRFALEADGWEFHSKRQDWLRDKRRQAALMRLGWFVYHTTWEDVTQRPRTVARDILDLFDFCRENMRVREVGPISAVSAEIGPTSTARPPERAKRRT